MFRLVHLTDIYQRVKLTNGKAFSSVESTWFAQPICRIVHISFNMAVIYFMYNPVLLMLICICCISFALQTSHRIASEFPVCFIKYSPDKKINLCGSFI